MRTYVLSDLLKDDIFKHAILEYCSVKENSADKDIVFDLSNIPPEELAKQYFADYELLANSYRPFKFNDYLKKNDSGENYILESPKYSVDIQTVRKEIINTFRLESWQIQVIQGENSISLAILISNWKDNNIKEIINSFERFGWFCSTSENEIVKTNIILSDGSKLDGDWVIRQFEPKYQPNVNETVRNYKFIYHLSPVYNLESILKNRFKVHSQNKKFNYPNRIFFLKGNIDQENIMCIGQQLCDMNTDSRNTGEYCLFTIKTNLIPSDINFYLDPVYEFGIFTEQDIPVETILEYEKLIFKH